ncbi:MAG: type II/IV secretion system protein [Calditrichaeota bacterium]|nr:type II/IV secretion system protein [Calditrichota bacterium]
MDNLWKLLPAEYALAHAILPTGHRNGTVLMAAAVEPDINLLNELQLLFDRQIEIELWSRQELLEAIREKYQLRPGQSPVDKETAQFEHLERHSQQAPPAANTVAGEDDHTVIHLVNRFISEAIRLKASDIHVESYENLFRIRFRIDGKLVESEKPPVAKRQAIISRLKIMADMDIAEKRRPQDGRIRMKNSHQTIDIRVSTLPTDFGEKIVLRILDKSALQLSLDALSMGEDILARFKQVLQLPFGMVLVTGPTGSGKTTTLYAALEFLNREDVNIITIEDPVEYNLTGINQTMVKADIGLTFSSILRTVLRQDPNIIMLGEIRDGETAEIAVRSALTGHLVLSTLHTNDALSTVVRLIDMGIEPFLVANSLKLVMAQRLVRKICPHCKTVDNDSRRQFERYDLPDRVLKSPLYRGAGCSHCYHTGFSGRQALIEAVVIDDDFAQLIGNQADIYRLRELAGSKQIPTLRDAGIQKVVDGETTLGEVVAETWVV